MGKGFTSPFRRYLINSSRLGAHHYKEMKHMKKLLSLVTVLLLIASLTTSFASEGAFIPLERGTNDTRTTTRVADMQTRLIELGFLKSKADGNFGPQTQAALKAFQEANGLTVTGIYDEADEQRLLDTNAVNAKGTTGKIAAASVSASSSSSSSSSASRTNTTTRRYNTNTPDNTRNTPDNTRNTPDNTRNTPDNTRNTPDNT